MLPLKGSQNDSISLERNTKLDYIESKVSLALGYSHPSHSQENGVYVMNKIVPDEAKNQSKIRYDLTTFNKTWLMETPIFGPVNLKSFSQ